MLLWEAAGHLRAGKRIYRTSWALTDVGSRPFLLAKDGADVARLGLGKVCIVSPYYANPWEPTVEDLIADDWEAVERGVVTAGENQK